MKISREAAPAWVFAGRIPSLDGMRAISILLVIVSHAFDERFHGTWSVGHFGVTCFFVISGFLITLLLVRERERSGKVSIPRFYQRRVLRIVPAYLTLIVAVAVLEYAGVYSISSSTWVRALTYTSCFSTLTMAPVLGHSWSLSVEEHFYLLWPILFKYCRPRTAVTILATYIAVAPVLRWLIVRNGIAWLDTSYSSPSQMASIAVGCVLAFAVTGMALSPRLLTAMGGLLLVCSFALGSHPDIRFVVSDTLRACGFGCVMVAILYMSPQNLLSRLLNSGPFTWIGVLSYSLYLWQQPLTRAMDARWWSFPALILIAWVSYRYIESPFLALKESMRRRTPAVIAVTP